MVAFVIFRRKHSVCHKTHVCNIRRAARSVLIQMQKSVYSVKRFCVLFGLYLINLVQWCFEIERADGKNRRPARQRSLLFPLRFREYSNWSETCVNHHAHANEGVHLFSGGYCHVGVEFVRCRIIKRKKWHPHKLFSKCSPRPTPRRDFIFIEICFQYFEIKLHCSLAKRFDTNVSEGETKKKT